jgi:hypothetical protein
MSLRKITPWPMGRGIVLLTRRQRPAGRLSRLVAVVLLAIAGSVAGGATAFAADPPPVAGIVVDNGSGVAKQAVQISRLYPGAHQQAVFLLEGADPGKARRIELGLTSLSDFENTCIHPETGSGDTTCGAGAGQGELSSFLDVILVAGREERVGDARSCMPDPIVAAVHSSLAGLRQQPVVVGLPDNVGVLCVIATFTHRDAVGDNVTQTDAVAFDLRLRFDTLTVDPVVPGLPPGDDDTPGGGTGGGGTGSTPDDGTQVEGVKHERPVVVSRAGRGRAELGALPRTGLPVQELMFTAALLLGAGTVMVVVVRSKRRRSTDEVT